jgi:hypothetical protein
MVDTDLSLTTGGIRGTFATRRDVLAQLARIGAKSSVRSLG